MLHAGFNAVEWDGCDCAMENEVANGTYLYRVVINGTNGDNVRLGRSELNRRAGIVSFFIFIFLRMKNINGFVV